MKQLWLSLFFVATLLVACSNPEPEEKTTTQNTENAASTTQNTMDEPVAQDAASTNVNGEAPADEEAPMAENTAASNGTSTTTTTTETTTSETPVVKTESVAVNENTPSVTTTTTTTKVASNNTVEPPKSSKAALSHDAFDQLLRKYVSSSGGVNYGGFKKDKAKLSAYLDLLKANTPQSNWSKNKEMAYWINMYNAFTIYAVVEKYPINSVMDLEGGKVWDKKKIMVGGKSLSLNIIEKDNLLKRFKEPRVHFAVNCAAASCPPLLNKAWTEDNVQRYLEKQAKAFINNTSQNTVTAKSVEASQIFNWYAGDFGGSDKIIPYFQKYASTKIKANAKVKFKEYDWKLNKQ